MSKGKSGGGGQAPAPVEAAKFNTDPSQWQNIGYQQSMSPYTAQGRPSWMQGHFSNPSWGMSAADPRVALTQEMLGPQGQQAQNAAVQEMAGMQREAPQAAPQHNGIPPMVQQYLMSQAPSLVGKGPRA
jgi:hypothetical protein